MRVLCVHIIASMLSAQALIMPISKQDGSLDLSSLLSHISLLEQKIENKASQTDLSKLEQTSKNDISKLESELQTARMEQKVTQSKLDTALEDLKDLSSVKTEQRVTQGKLDTALDELNDLSNVKTELAVLQNQIQSGNFQCSCGSSGSQQAQDLSGLRGDVSTLKSEVKQIKSLTNQTDVSSLSADVSTIKTEIVQLQSLHNRTATSQSTLQGNSVYTRWGRTSCPTGNNVVYKGYAAGSYYDANGGSPSILCLPELPIYSNHSFGVHDDDTSQIWGTEYGEDYTDMPFSPLSNEDMPCVVCESKRATSIMVPARNACYQGWTLEYSGYLMGGYRTHSPADYICVDTDAEPIPGGHDLKYGRRMYPVESKCGALVCPPYVEGKMVTCVFCSK